MKRKRVGYAIAAFVGAAALALLMLPAGTLYAGLSKLLPSEVRGWYCGRVLSEDGVLASDADKQSLLMYFIESGEGFPEGAYGELIDAAKENSYDPIGIMALEVAFDTNDRRLICPLFADRDLSDAFSGKVDIYRQEGPRKKEMIDKALLECMRESSK